MRPCQMIHNLFNAFFGCGRAHFCACACAQSFGNLYAQLDARCRLILLQGLRIGIRDNELNAFQLLFNHVVHSIAASTANAKHRDAWS